MAIDRIPHQALRSFGGTNTLALWSAIRVLVFVVAAGLPVLSISAHVFGVASIHWLALFTCLPATALATALGVGGSPEAAFARMGLIAGLLAVTAYDATRLPFVLTGVWPDFIPRIGGWVLGSDEPNVILD